MKGKLRMIVALALIIVGIGALTFWETSGREMVMNTDVVVANTEINQGQTITAEMLSIQSVPTDNVIQGACKAADATALVGQVAAQYIPTNAQMSQNYIYEDEFFVRDNESIFYIPQSWIDSMSTSLRRGDEIEIWRADASYKIGEYTIAFAKNQSEEEVTNVTEQKYNDALDRTYSSSVVTHFEIICTLNEYKQLYKEVTGIDYVVDEEMEIDPETEEAEKTAPSVINKLLIIQKVGA